MSSNTQKIFLENFEKLKLTKVRLKVDPLNAKLKNFAYLNGYEGYILNEYIDTETVDVILLGDIDDPVIRNLPKDCVDEHSLLSKLDKFKISACYYLKHVMDLKDSADVLEDIHMAASISDIEKILKRYGLNKESICEIYKLYVLSNDTFE